MTSTQTKQSKDFNIENHVLRSVTLPKSLDNMVREYAIAMNMSPTTALRILIQEGMEILRGDKDRPLHPWDLYKDFKEYLEKKEDDKR